MAKIFENLDNWASIRTATGLIAKGTTTLRSRVQQTALAIIALGATGEQDARNAPAYALALVNALGKGINAKALVSFFALHCPLYFGEDEGKKPYCRIRADTLKQGKEKGEPNPRYVAWNPEGAALVMWWDCKADDKETETPTYAAFVSKLDKLLKAALSDKEGNPVEYASDDDRTKVEALVAALRTVQAGMAGAKPSEPEPEAEAEAAPRTLAVAV